MKRPTTLLLIFFFLFGVKYANGQDCPWHVSIGSTTQANLFISEYPNCTRINGGLHFSGNTDVTTGFANIKYIHGNLSVNGGSVTGTFAQLDTIMGDILVNAYDYGSVRLEAIFPNLKYIGGKLYISDIQEYSAHIDASFPALKRIEGDISSCGGWLSTITCNDCVNLSYIGGNIKTPAAGLNSLDTIMGTIDFETCNYSFLSYNLSGYDELKYIGGDLILGGYDECVTDLSGFQQLNTINGDFLYYWQYDYGTGCGLVDTINGLNQLRHVNGNFRIYEAEIENLDFMSNLETVGGNLVIDNNTLNDINGLNHTIYVGGTVDITGNNNLSDCNVQAVCDHINSFGETIITNNVSGCTSVAEVQSQCPDASCLPQGITFTSQQEIDDFSSNYSTCLHIEGEVIIEEATVGEITNLQGLQSIRAISGGLTIRNNSTLTNLSGLDYLNQAGTFITIINNDLLTDIEALQLDGSQITNLQITDNPNLTVCDTELICNYLNNGGSATVNGNALSCESTDKILEICNVVYDCLTGGITLSTQSEVDNFIIDYPYCSEINGSLTIGGQGSDIANLDALNQVNQVDGNLNISGESVIDISGLSNLATVIGHINISSTGLENLSGLSALSTFDQDLIIADNELLTAINAFQNIDHLNNITITGNDNLQNVDNSFDIITIDTALVIENNNALTNLSGFDNIYYRALDSLSIQNNPNLSMCSADNICYYLGSFKPASINNNASGCNTIDEIISNCSLNCECLGTGATFIYQFQVDNFAENYPGCTKIMGTVRFGEYSIYSNFQDYTDNVDGLSHIEYMGGLVLYNGAGYTDFPNVDTLGAISIIDMTSNNFEGLSNLKHIENDFSISYGNYLLSSFEGLEQLNSIGGSFRANTLYYNLSDFIGLENLTYIGEDLIIENNNSLTSLTGFDNIESIGGNLIIQDNSNLSMCNVSSVCNHLLNDGAATIQNNAQDCDDEQEILFFCNDIAYVEVHTFYDVNQNQIQDSNEPNMGSVVTVEPQSATYYTDSDLLYFLPGSYTITFNETAYSDWTLTTDSISYFVNLEAYERDTISFGIFPDVLLSHVQTSVSSPPTRCNELITFDINTKNLATTIADGVIWLEVDENILATNFIDTPDTTAAPNLYGWFFEDLFPSQSLTRQIDLQIPGPPDFPVGDYLFFDTYTDFEDENGGQSSQNFTYEAEVRCSYDPNDKLVNPARTGDYTLFDENLIYTVRFQNTGNDVAYDVVIQDTLDANLDLESFRVLGSSHPNKLQTSMTPDGILTFEFRNIFLPDSTSNFEGSQGYVSYLIRAIDGLSEGTPITNSAGIYFDLNPPVLTNTTQNVMVSELPALPVELPDPLRVYLNNQTAILKWRTATETNNSGFEIQRSKDGINWEKIGWQAGQGTTSISYAYEYRDVNPLSGTSYYRLKQIDFDGQFEYSNIVSLRYSLPIADISPNPTDGRFRVKNTSQGKYQIHDTKGRIIQSGELKNDLSIDISSEAQGVYFISIQIENETITKRIIKI